MTRHSDSERYARLFDALDQTALQPDAWSEVCDQLAGLVGALGTMFIPVKVEQRLPGIPMSRRLEERQENYFKNGWNLKDPRAEGAPLMLARGYVTDQDFIGPEKMARHPFYAEHLISIELQWFLGLGFQANGDFWCAAIQGTPRRGPFLKEDVERVMNVRKHVGIAAQRTAVYGWQRSNEVTSSFELAGRGVIGLDAFGQVTFVSPIAEQYLNGPLTVGRMRLHAAEDLTDRKLSALVRAACSYDPWESPILPAPVKVFREGASPLSVEALPMPRDYHTVFAGTLVLVAIREINDEISSPGHLLRELFGLTPTEIRLVLALCSGRSLDEAADALAVTKGTARIHLKSIFAKTDTHRQAELVALFARLQQ